MRSCCADGMETQGCVSVPSGACGLDDLVIPYTVGGGVRDPLLLGESCAGSEVAWLKANLITFSAVPGCHQAWRPAGLSFR